MTNNLIDGELYIFMGLQDDTFFFIHTKYEKEFELSFSYQIMNVLIHIKMIKDFNKNVVIYEYDYDIKKSADVVVIQHKDNKNPKSFNKKTLRAFLSSLIKASRNKTLVVRYDYKSKSYLSYDVPQNLFENIDNSGSNKINSITNVLF